MKRAARRILWSLATFLGALLLSLLVLVVMLRSAPAYYQPLQTSPERLEAAARRAEDKLVDIRNAAAESRLHDGAPTVSTYIVTFTQDELNAFLTKWSELSAVRGQLAGRAQGPLIVLRPGRVILAGQVNLAGVGTVVGIHLRPRLDENGLSIAIEQVTAGRVPLPRAAWESQVQRLIRPLSDRQSIWRRSARLDKRGDANDDAIKAVYADLLLSILDGRAVEPVVLIPLDGGRGVAARLTELSVTNESVTLHAKTLTLSERQTFIARLSGD